MAAAQLCRLLWLFALLGTGHAIDCYACTSIAGSDPACEDEFQMDLSTVHLIVRDCQYGHFGATHCYKMKGIRKDGTPFLVRHCSDADWGKSCGNIHYIFDGQEERIQGCLSTCEDDGCNTAPARIVSWPVLTIIVLVGYFCSLR